MQQTHEIAENEDSYSRVASLIEARNAKFEDADIWLRGNAGEELDSVESFIYQELLDTKWVRAYWQSQSEIRLGSTGEIPLHDFAWFLYKNPGARTAWEDNAEERNAERSVLLDRAPRGPMAVQDIVRADLIKPDQLKP